MKAYLLVYNLASCIGWGYLLSFVVRGLIESWTASMLWQNAGTSLMVIQSFAILEIFHSLFGFVRSPVMTNVMQVASRLTVLFAYTYWCPASPNHWSFYFMMGSWSLVEVPRYLFYAVNLYSKKPHAFLFWLRYNLFAILYPTGIFGELGQMWSSLVCWRSIYLPMWYLTNILFLFYIPGAPTMYMHMVKQRSRATKKRIESDLPPKPEAGILFPKNEKGIRSTTETNKNIWSSAVRGIGNNLSERIQKERNWRFKYEKYIIEGVAEAAGSESDCVKIAEQGISSVMQSFEFAYEGRIYSLPDAMKQISGTFTTHHVVGSNSEPKSPFSIPYKGKVLKEKQIIEQLDKWTEYGSIEPDTRNAIASVVENEKWHDLSDRYFVLLGASSAMGPLEVLLSLGANIIAVDIDKPEIWRKLLNLARNSNGTLTFPLRKKLTSDADEELCMVAGCNLLTETPQILHWLKGLYPGEELIVGCYTYLDGASHVQITVACDLIMSGLIEARNGVSLAFLPSPSDVFLYPGAAVDAQNRNYTLAPWWQKLISSITGHRWLKKNTGPDVECKQSRLLEKKHVRSGISVRQGPNYALAKRIQHWRAIIALHSGTKVSANVAPSTATQSVVHNPLFAAAYGGMHLFKPYEVFEEDTSKHVMAALLIYDTMNEDPVEFDNPLQIFERNSFNGGVWRCGYSLNSIGEVSVIAYYLKKGVSALIFASLVAGLAVGGFITLDLPAPHELW